MKKNFIYFAIMIGKYALLIFSVIVTSSSLISARSGYGQKLDPKKIFISLRVENQPLDQLFKEIENETQFRFIYDGNTVNASQPLSLVETNESLANILLHLAKVTGLEFKQIENYFSVRPKTGRSTEALPVISPVRPSGSVPFIIPADIPPAYSAKDTLITGAVINDQGEPLVGVTVQVKGMNIGTVTDASGKFSIQVPEDLPLVFSYVGYNKREIVVNKKFPAQITLNTDASGLNEVVVVGYGTQRKMDVTGAVSQVSGTEVRETPTANLQNGLNGKLPGFFSQQRSGQPGSESAATVFVRGVSTFTGSQQPLVLVNNIEYPYDQLYLIDANEVESISILKDAAATAIYGIKGANGVILITTRRGKVGKAVIHFRTNWGIQSPVHILKTLDAYQTALLQNEADINDDLTPMFTDEDLALFKSGADPYGHPNVDWYHTLFKKSTLLTNNNLDISGGTDRVQYFITLGYMFQNGLVKDIPYKGPDQVAEGKTQINTNFFAKSYKFRSDLDIQATNTLRFQLDITGTRQTTSRPKADYLFPTIFRYDYQNPFMMPVYNPDGSFGWANPNWMSPPASSNNIAAVYALNGYTRTLNDFINAHLSGTQRLDDLLKGLSLKASVAYSTANIATKTLTRYAPTIPTYWYNSADGSYQPRDPSVYTIPPYQLVYDGGTPYRQLNLQGAINYDQSFGKNNVGGMILYNQTSYINGSDAPANFRGYTFRFTYNYNHKYLLEVSGAYNGSSRFVTQKRYQLFPAISGGWNLAEEKFIKNNFSFVEAFKIRGSYGSVGSDNIGSGNQYLYEQIYNRSGSYSFGEYDNQVNSIVEGTQGNMDVTWETEKKADIGLDFALFKGKISGSFDYFNNYRYHILTKRSTIPTYFGVQRDNLPPVNIGTVRNKGYEIEIVYKGQLKNLGFNIKGDFSFAKNAILFMDEPPPKYPWEKQTGRSIGMIRQWTWLGFYEDQKDIDSSAAPAGVVKPGYLKYKDLNGDGIIDNDDKAFMGYPNLPNTNIGLTIGFTYKGVTLSALLQAALNFDVYMGNGNAVPFKTDLQPLHLGRWTPETAATATFPTLTNTFNGSYMNPDNRSTFWTTRGDYLRIRSVYLSYEIPKTLVTRVGLEQAKIYVNGYDLFTWSKFLDRFQFDPETASGAGGYVYPQERILNFGINLTFK